MSDDGKSFRVGLLLHHLIALLCGAACLAACAFVAEAAFENVKWESMEAIQKSWNAIHTFWVIGVAVGVYLISKIFAPVRL